MEHTNPSSEIKSKYGKVQTQQTLGSVLNTTKFLSFKECFEAEPESHKISSNHTADNLCFWLLISRGPMRMSQGLRLLERVQALPQRSVMSYVQSRSPEPSNPQFGSSLPILVSSQSRGGQDQSMTLLAEFRQELGVFLLKRLEEEKTYRVLSTDKKETLVWGNDDSQSRPLESQYTTEQEAEFLKAFWPPRTLDQFLELSMKSKSLSILFQRRISIAPMIELTQLVNWAIECISPLVSHQYGNYIVQHLARRSQHVLASALKECKALISQNRCDENSSRLVQALLELDDGFLQMTLELLRTDLGSYFKDISKVYLAGTILRVAGTRGLSIDFLLEDIKANTEKWLSSKYRKRLMVSYLFSCSTPKLQEVFNFLQIGQRIPELLQNKYSCYLLLAFLERRYRPCESAFLKQLTKQPGNLIKAKFFDFFFTKALTLSAPEFIRDIHITLKIIEKDHLLFVQVSDCFYFFGFLLLETCRNNSFEEVAQIFIRNSGYLSPKLCEIAKQLNTQLILARMKRDSL